MANHMERLFDLSSRETIGLVFLDVKSNCHNKVKQLKLIQLLKLWIKYKMHFFLIENNELNPSRRSQNRLFFLAFNILCLFIIIICNWSSSRRKGENFKFRIILLKFCVLHVNVFCWEGMIVKQSAVYEFYETDLRATEQSNSFDEWSVHYL